MTSQEDFAHQVKDALLNFHDAMHLQTHPLLAMLVVSDKEGMGAQSLRHILRENLEQLRPDKTVPLGRPEWLGFRSLWLRYIEACSIEEACGELGVSRATFYRAHKEALEALVSLLRHHQKAVAKRSPIQPDSQGGHAPDAVAHLIDSVEMQRVQPEHVLESAIGLLRPVAAQQGVMLEIAHAEGCPLVLGSRALFRQVLLSCFSELLRRVADQALQVTMSPEDGQVVVRVQGLALDTNDIELLGQSSGFHVGERLLSAQNGTLGFERDEPGSLCFYIAIPVICDRTVVIMDDDADTVSLYQRYLQGQSFVTRHAQDWTMLDTMLRVGSVDLILLDVLMPNEDGWDVLQRLKNSPETATIPVVVCSVLDQPRLALSQGVSAVMQKPIDQKTLLRTIHSLIS